jgi:hypothetical protein
VVVVIFILDAYYLAVFCIAGRLFPTCFSREWYKPRVLDLFS